MTCNATALAESAGDPNVSGLQAIDSHVQEIRHDSRRGSEGTGPTQSSREIGADFAAGGVMPGNEGRSANPVGSVRTPEKARPAVRKHQKNRGSAAAARACAARLMAPGAALAIPRLSRGCLDPFCPAGDRKGFLLARTLLQAGIGDAQDWQDSHGAPVQFMARTDRKSVV